MRFSPLWWAVMCQMTLHDTETFKIVHQAKIISSYHVKVKKQIFPLTSWTIAIIWYEVRCILLCAMSPDECVCIAVGAAVGRLRRCRWDLHVALQRREQTHHQNPAERLRRCRLHDQSQETGARWDASVCLRVFWCKKMRDGFLSLLVSDLGGLSRTQRRREISWEDLRGEHRAVHSGEGADRTRRLRADALLGWRSIRAQWSCAGRWQDRHMEGRVESVRTASYTGKTKTSSPVINMMNMCLNMKQYTVHYKQTSSTWWDMKKETQHANYTYIHMKMKVLICVLPSDEVAYY